MAALRVNEVTEVTRELVESLARLLPQLSSSSPPPTEAEVEAIVASAATALFIARLATDGEDEGEIVGRLTLATFPIPTGVRAWIEDVVVDEAARGRGIGEALTAAALDEALRRGAKTVELTSRPSRVAANRLYQRLGFAARDTNVYRYDLEASHRGPG
jgi:ribosomal protein S18 acetylase RimI-like enzyme